MTRRPCLFVLDTGHAGDAPIRALVEVLMGWGATVHRISGDRHGDVPEACEPDLIVLAGRTADGLLAGSSRVAALVRGLGVAVPVMLVTEQVLGRISTAVARAGIPGAPVPPELELLHRICSNRPEEVPAPKLAISSPHPATEAPGGFIGTSPAMLRVYSEILAAAPSSASVFVTGESGTGKELCVEAIHGGSSRSGGPLISINCSAIPKDLIESEIFGHERGSFTGATGRRDGAAIQADGGTLFLDELCEMDLGLQSKLLRFLQSGLVQRVGGTKPQMVDVRIICATNRDPLCEVEAGRLREDLYYRLHVIPISLPPLRGRGRDILLLAHSFLRRFAAEENKRFDGFDARVERILMTYSWPGNVRQLENLIQNIVVMNPSGPVVPSMLPLALAQASEARPSPPRLAPSRAALTPGQPYLAPDHGPAPPSVEPLWVQERRSIERAIASCNGNLTKAAALLEINPSTLYRKRRAWACDAA